MKNPLRLLAILAAVMTLMVLTASVALAHPGVGGGDGIATAVGRVEVNPPQFDNGNGDGGMQGNKPVADMGEWVPCVPEGEGCEEGTGEFQGQSGKSAMLMQVLHSPLCSAHSPH